MASELIVAFVVIAILFILKLPAGFALFIGSMSYLAAAGKDVAIVVEIMLGKLANNYVVLAVPLFIFAANLMNAGKITERVFQFALTLVGRRQGGLGHVNVIASLIFSGMTGSAVADASGLGIMEIETMKKEGYDSGFSAAITAASSIIGPIFPPSIPFVIYGWIANVSIGNLFLAGMVPGVMLAIALMVYVAIVAKKRNYPRGEAFVFKKFVVVTLSALPAILTPVILLTGIYTGIMTATEAGAIAALYAMIVTYFVYRSLSRKEFLEVLVNSVRTTGQIGILIAGSFGFCYIVAVSGLPRTIGEFIAIISTSRELFLLIVVIGVLIMGMFVDSVVIQLLTLPILVPIAKDYGIDLVHFGVVFTFATMIGLCTPPFGSVLFIVTGISKESIAVVIKELFPMILVMIIVLLILTYIPSTFMWVPQIFGR